MRVRSAASNFGNSSIFRTTRGCYWPKGPVCCTFATPIIWAVRWYLMFPVSYRDMMRVPLGLEVDQSTA